MQKVVNGYMKVIFIFVSVAAAWFIWAAFGRQMLHAVFRVPDFSMEDRSVPLLTSTEYRYDNKFQDTLDQYSRFSSLYEDEVSTAIPGLRNTMIGDKAVSQMVPQGLCVAGDYMLVTAYDNGGSFAKETNYKGDYTVSRSVIYVLSNTDASNREFLTTIVLPDINHVGGITFDGKYVWIAKSTTQQCSAIDYRIIRQAALLGQESYELEAYTTEADCGVTASFVTYYDSRLWVGTFRSRLSGKGTLSSYRIEETKGDVRLVPDGKLTIPAYANGVTFAEVGGSVCMAVTSSCGRYGDSKVYLYEVVGSGASATYISRGVYSFPPMAEEMVTDGGYTYFLFESAATCYSTIGYRKCSYPVDRICGVSSKELFFWAAEPRIAKSSEADAMHMNPIPRDEPYYDWEKLLRMLKYEADPQNTKYDNAEGIV